MYSSNYLPYPAIHLNGASFHKDDSAGAQSSFQTQNVSNAIRESLLGTEMSLVPKCLSTEMSLVPKCPRTEMSQGPKCPRTEMSLVPKCPRTEMSQGPKCPCTEMSHMLLGTEMSQVPKCPRTEMSPVPKCRYRNVPGRNVWYRNSRQPIFLTFND